MDAIHFIVVIDADGNEALYVGGDLFETEGDAVYSTDIADAAKDMVIQFSHVEVEHNPDDNWPSRVEELVRTGIAHGRQRVFDLDSPASVERADRLTPNDGRGGNGYDDAASAATDCYLLVLNDFGFDSEDEMQRYFRNKGYVSDGIDIDDMAGDVRKALSLIEQQCRLLDRSLSIINNAIMHGMLVTDEVAAVLNAIRRVGHHQ